MILAVLMLTSSHWLCGYLFADLVEIGVLLTVRGSNVGTLLYRPDCGAVLSKCTVI